MKKYNSGSDSDHNALGSEPEDSRDIEHSFNKVDEGNFANHKVKRALSSHPVGQQDIYASSLGLPFGWSGRNIPTGKQLLEAATRSYKRMQNRLLNDQTVPSELQLKFDSETIIQTSEFAALLPEVVDLTLKLKDRFFGAASLNLWNTLLIKLFHKATNYDVDKDT